MRPLSSPRRRKKQPWDPNKDLDHRTGQAPRQSSVIQFPSEPHRPGLDILVVERRFLRACKTIRVLPDREAKFFNVNSCWPEVVQTFEEAYGYGEVSLPRFRPNPFDVSDVLTALSWARELRKNEFRIAWWRSFDLSFGQISRRIGRSDETARRYYRDTMLKLWSEANLQYLGVGA